MIVTPMTSHPATHAPGTGTPCGPGPGMSSPGAAPTNLGASRRVLVVDDCRDSAESLSPLLRFEGYDVRVAYDGQVALSLTAEWWPDVAVLDLGMPGMDGCELARRLRAQPRGERLVLIALTGWTGDEYRRRSRAAGFDHYFNKPVSLEPLLEAIGAPPGSAGEQ